MELATSPGASVERRIAARVKVRTADEALHEADGGAESQQARRTIGVRILRLCWR